MQDTKWIDLGDERVRFVLSRGKVRVETYGKKGSVPYEGHWLQDAEDILAVVSRDKKYIGTVVGADTRCSLEGCGGRRIPVRWLDGKLTRPCTKDMTGEGAVSWMRRW